MTEEIGRSPASLSRPRHVVGVAGTGTDVGKTYWSVRILRSLVQKGWTVQARKPAQSYEGGTAVAETDAGLLAEAAGGEPETVCPSSRWYPLAMAPPMASAKLGRSAIAMDDLVQEVEKSWSGRAADFALVETAGGVFSPLADTPTEQGDDCAAFLAALGVDEVLLIADAGLGTINSVRASVQRLAAVGIGRDRVTVGLSRFDPSDAVHATNLVWLQDRDRVSVCTTPEDIAAALIDGAPTHCVRCGEELSPRSPAIRSALRPDDTPAVDPSLPARGAPQPDSAHRCANLHEIQLDVGLEPERFCGRCGRRMRVVITPTRTDSVCVEHGADFRHGSATGPVDG